jgi:hypothetical protein
MSAFQLPEPFKATNLLFGPHLLSIETPRGWGRMHDEAQKWLSPGKDMQLSVTAVELMRKPHTGDEYQAIIKSPFMECCENGATIITEAPIAQISREDGSICFRYSALLHGKRVLLPPAQQFTEFCSYDINDVIFKGQFLFRVFATIMAGTVDEVAPQDLLNQVADSLLSVKLCTPLSN